MLPTDLSIVEIDSERHYEQIYLRETPNQINTQVCLKAIEAFLHTFVDIDFEIFEQPLINWKKIIFIVTTNWAVD